MYVGQGKILFGGNSSSDVFRWSNFEAKSFAVSRCFSTFIPFVVVALLMSTQLDSLAFRYNTPEKNAPLLVRAKTLLAHEDIEDALSDFRKLIKQEPRNFEGYLGVADCLYFQSDYLNALSSVNTALSLNPKSAEAHRRRGKIHEKLHQWKDAIDDYTSAINLSPGNHLYLSDRSFVFSKMGEYAKAIADLDRYVKLVKRPKPVIFYSRSNLYAKLGKKEEAAAERKRGDMISNGAY